MQTSYPIFESGQVLTSQHLNDLVDYLEEQDRLTRHKLIGIGIACGLEIDYQFQDNQIRITKGCAVTSEGYLIIQDESVLNQFRDYTLPVPSLEEAPDGLVDISRYAFFVDDNGDQIPLWELLPTDYTPAPGESPPTAISSVPGFLDDKVVMLFLESNLESLKNCDINDCSDKGIEKEFTLRQLLLTKTDAQAILEQEQNIAQRPVERHNHPGYDLKELKLAKINPAAYEIDNFAAFFFRILAIAFELAPSLVEALKNSYLAYEYLLAEIYPADRFPNGPFGDVRYFDNVWGNLLENIFLAQYFYGYMLDVVQAYNEFIKAAILLEAECCPNPERFPRHVLLGIVAEQPKAPVVVFNGPADVIAFDPLSANSGLGARTKPEECRHHFIPSLLFDRQQEKLRQVQSLHYCLYLLAYRYSTENLMEGEIKITPSKEGDYALSSKSIPYYYKFQFGDDLHRNWSFERTIINQLEQVFSYQFINLIDHPLQYRMDDHNFYRIEGTVGKPLGQVMQELLAQKRQLGLSFGIEPVFIGVKFGDDLSSLDLNQQATERAQLALLKLLACRMRDLDVVFLLLIATLFYYLFSIIALLSQSNTTAIAKLTSSGNLSGDTLESESEQPPLIAQRRFEQRVVRPKIDRQQTEAVLKEIRTTTYLKGSITRRVTTINDPKVSIGKLYDQIKESPDDSSNLFDRTLAFAQELSPDEDPEIIAGRIYPSISLLDQSEKLVEIASASSVAEFDFQKFEVTYEGFVQAFDRFVAETEKDDPDSEPDPEIKTTQEMLITNYNAIATTTPQAILSNLATEVQKRLEQIFQELTLEAYGKRHPGMKHQAGVPVGGTLILLYTHKEFVAQVLEQNRTAINNQVEPARSSYLAIAEPSDIRSPIDILVANPLNNEPLDDFVVLADFAVPYLCCDTDCSDVDLQIRERPTAEPATVRGSVFRDVGTSTQPQLAVIETAEVNAFNQSTNAPIAIQVNQGNYSFEAPAAIYRILATAEGFNSAQTLVTLTAGSSQTHNFVLEPTPDQPAKVSGTIFGNFGNSTRVLESAEVTVTNISTNADVDVEFDNGIYNFTVSAGKYKIEVTATRFQPAQEELALESGSLTSKNFILEPIDPDQPATVTGTIFEADRQGNIVGKVGPENELQVKVTDLSNNEPVDVQLDFSNYKFTVPAGKYKIAVTANEFSSAEEELTLESGSSITKDFNLVRNQF